MHGSRLLSICLCSCNRKSHIIVAGKSKIIERSEVERKRQLYKQVLVTRLIITAAPKAVHCLGSNTGRKNENLVKRGMLYSYGGSRTLFNGLKAVPESAWRLTETLLFKQSWSSCLVPFRTQVTGVLTQPKGTVLTGCSCYGNCVQFVLGICAELS